jgi:hypothetical protein
LVLYLVYFFNTLLNVIDGFKFPPLTVTENIIPINRDSTMYKSAQYLDLIEAIPYKNIKLPIVSKKNIFNFGYEFILLNGGGSKFYIIDIFNVITDSVS